MIILAIDTTGEFGSVALRRDGVLLEEAVLHSPEGFGHVLFGQIDALLRRHGLMVREVDRFAAASGPGSFTGVRVGLTAAKGLAEACGRPMVAVSNLKALAWYGTGALRAAFLDARRGEIYGAVYDDALRLVADEQVMKFPEWRSGVPAGATFVTTDPGLFAGVEAEPAPRAMAAAVAAIAEGESAVDAAAIDANYVRRSDAELLWRDR